MRIRCQAQTFQVNPLLPGVVIYDTKSDPIAPFWVLVVETYPTLREPLRGTGTARLTPSCANAEPPERLG
jgi:hypothetical protein